VRVGWANSVLAAWSVGVGADSCRAGLQAARASNTTRSNLAGLIVRGTLYGSVLGDLWLALLSGFGMAVELPWYFSQADLRSQLIAEIFIQQRSGAAETSAAPHSENWHKDFIRQP